ncbi:MAG: 3-hydroxybutyrate dehydrogenase [Actinomycetota bacterium]
MSTLSGRRAVITGGAAGIGAAIARAFAAEGATVVIADRDGAAAAALAEELGGESWEVDLLDVGSLESLSLEADILVNNAGIQRVAPIVDFEPEAWRRIHTLMLEVPFLLTRAVMPGMQERGWGRILNISSVHGLIASPFKSAYVAAKHGLEGLSKVTALEGAPHGVTSNCINPGWVRTALVEAQIADQAEIHGIPESEVLERVMLTEPAIKRLLEPEEIGALALFLAGPHAGMATGASYVMDGGWTTR